MVIGAVLTTNVKWRHGVLVSQDPPLRGLPLIIYASRGGGGVNTNAYKCVQGGRGGSEYDQKYAFCMQFHFFFSHKPNLTCLFYKI